MFYIIDWDTKKVIGAYEKLTTAKRKCRALGHTGEDNSLLTGFPPVAYVANINGEVIYNPRFAKKGVQCLT